MKNPWTTKNPFMSAWLSSANQIMGSARGHASAEMQRQVTRAQADAARQVMDFWTGKTASSVARKKRR